MENRFDFQVEQVAQEIRKRKAKKIVLQFAEGIKQNASDVVNDLETRLKNVEFIVSGDSAWGGCDLALNEAKEFDCDLIVHFGHAQFIKTKFPVMYVFVKDNTDLTSLLKKSLEKIKKNHTMGLVSSVQHIHKLKEIKQFYESNGKKVLIPEAVGFSCSNGHVVGCEYRGLKLIKDKIDSVIVVGNRFHGLGAALSIPDKDVYLLDSYNNVVESMQEFRSKIMKQRFIAIDKIKRARKIGIVVGTKVGQKFGSANLIKKEFEKQGKQVLIITMNEMTPDKIFNFYDLQGFVELACPRIATDDFGKYEKPIITFKEALVVLGKLKGEELMKSGFW